MDIIYVLIGFVCGFLCRQVILLQQMTKARAEFEEMVKSMKNINEREQDGD